MPSLNPNCTKCELHKSSTTVCVAGETIGNSRPKVIIIGEAPGANEAKTGRPFTGQSGKLLRAELEKAGVGSYYLTNLVKCRPPDNRTPTKSEIDACSSYLQDEIKTHDPEIIVPLGSPATQSFFKKAKITQVHGELLEWQDKKLMPSFHPAYTLYDVSKLPIFQTDLRRLGKITRGEQTELEIDWDIVGRHNLDEFIETFKECDEFAFDTETSGLFPFDKMGYIHILSLAFNNKAWVVPLSHRQSRMNRIKYDIMKILFELARDKFGIAQNGKFDNKWLQIYYKDRFPLHFDTMLAHHVLDENNNHDLDTLSLQYLNAKPYNIPLNVKIDNTQYLKKQAEYAAKDAYYTLKLYEIFDKMLMEDHIVRRLFYRLVMRGARILEDVELLGMFLDLDKYEDVEDEQREKLMLIERELSELVGPGVNWDSPQQVSEILYGKLGLKPTVFTPKKKPSTNEEALAGIKGKHPVADLIVSYRETQKFLTTYIGGPSKKGKRQVGWKPFMVGSKLFLDYKVHGTVTGRYSSRLHQIPRDGTIRNLIEGAVESHFVQIDYSTAEMRIAAIMSECPELLRCFREGIDVHWRTLMSVIAHGGGEYVKPALDTAYELQPGKHITLHRALSILLKAGPNRCIDIWSGWKEGRKRAKAINFGFIYGMYEKKFIQQAKVKYGFEPTWDEAHMYREIYFQTYPGLLPWHNKQKKLAKLNGQVRGLSGRVRRLPGIYSSNKMARMEAERQAINAPVQGFIGDYKVMGMDEVADRFAGKVHICGEHHDAILTFIFHIDYSEQLLYDVLEAMEKPRLCKDLRIDLPIRMTAEATVGPCWGKGKSFVISNGALTQV